MLLWGGALDFIFHTTPYTFFEKDPRQAPYSTRRKNGIGVIISYIIKYLGR